MARYSGNGSIERLFIDIYNIKTTIYYGSIPQPPVGAVKGLDSPILLKALSFVQTGTYEDVTYSQRNTTGGVWESRVVSDSVGRGLYFHNSFVSCQHNNVKNRGLSVRCAAKRGDATDSICPKGWEMARWSGDGYNSFRILLVNTYGKVLSEKLFDSKSIYFNIDSGLKSGPLHFTYSGAIISTSVFSDRNTISRYWIKRITSLEYARATDTQSSRVYPQNNASKGDGLSVRRVAKCV